jgi:putative membrane protein
MMVMMVAFWAFVVVAIVWVVRALSTAHEGDWSSAPRARSPQDILAERYARGEIDSEEFRRRLDDIEAHVRR